jgi:hypothetical protein
MITDLDLRFTRTRSHATPRGGGAARGARFSRFQPASPFQLRAEHEAAFERAHGSLWTPGLLDRLSLPLSRIHE